MVKISLPEAFQILADIGHLFAVNMLESAPRSLLKILLSAELDYLFAILPVAHYFSHYQNLMH